MTIICAWCKKDIGEKEPYENKTVTHGVCKICSDQLKEKYKIIGPLYWDDIERIKNSVADRNPM